MPKDLYQAEYPKFKDVGGNAVFNEYSYGWIQKDVV